VPQVDGSPAARPLQPPVKTSGGTAVTAQPQPVRDSTTVADGYWEADDEADVAPMTYQVSEIESKRNLKRAEAVLPSRSETIQQVRQDLAQQEAEETQKKAEKSKKKKKKRKKKTGDFDPKDTLILVGCLGGFVALLAVLGWRFPDFRFPLGGFLCVVGFIVYVLGAVSLRQLVAEEGLIKLMLFRFFPPYQWWFVATRWSETRDFAAFFASGLMILAIGGAIIKMSPTGKKAEESERSYQTARQGSQAEAPPALSEGTEDGGD
jgi:hypothetical protein